MAPHAAAAAALLLFLNVAGPPGASASASASASTSTSTSMRRRTTTTTNPSRPAAAFGLIPSPPPSAVRPSSVSTARAAAAVLLRSSSSSSSSSSLSPSLEWWPSKPRRRRFHHRLNAVGGEEEEGGGGGDDDDDAPTSSDAAWMSLAATERWIEETLNPPPDPASEGGGGGGGDGPYARKKISYSCVDETDAPSVAWRIFSTLREKREAGERHGEKMREVGDPKVQSTRRETSVIVIPRCEGLTASFEEFDDLVGAINAARRDARDYVTAVEEEKRRAERERLMRRGGERGDGGGGGPDPGTWLTAVNLSHMHPLFDGGDADEDEDPKVAEYRERRTKARRSPYPTCVVEVKSSPRYPSSRPPQGAAPGGAEEDGEGGGGSPRGKNGEGGNVGSDSSPASAADIEKLEALLSGAASFGSAPIHDGGSRAWAAEVLGVTDAANVVSCDAVHVDEAYEGVFALVASKTAGAASASGRDCVVMPRFCARSSTSFARFAEQLNNIAGAMPTLRDKLKFSTFHPEQVESSGRSPDPILVLDWGDAVEEGFEEDSVFE